MPRVKRGTHRIKRRKNILKRARGYRWGRKNKIRLAKVATTKAGAHAYRDRRGKKRSFRRLWTVKLNAALRVHDISYSAFIGLLKKSKIDLDRKVLAELAERDPVVFEAIVKEVR